MGRNRTLSQEDQDLVNALVEERRSMRAQIKEHKVQATRLRKEVKQISNDQLAEKFGVHIETIKRIIYPETI